ncbi:MAG: zf-HC2 domain-containing protein [Acidobacteria bacterium]|nr:zf-HC2 domain-containing protein [Acidobacteriota bacterium]
MAEHFSNEFLEDYRQRLLSAADLLRADKHLSDCQACREKLGDEACLQSVASSLEEELISAVDDEVGHLSDDQLSAYISGRIGQIEREIIESHLSWCADCLTEVRDLHDFAKQLSTGQSAGISIWAALLDGIKNFWQIFEQPPLMRAARALVILMLTLAIPALIISRITLQKTGDSSIGSKDRDDLNARSSQVPALSDQKLGTSPTPAITDRTGKTEKIALDLGELARLDELHPDDQRFIKRAIESQKIMVAPVIAQLQSREMVLMGATKESSFEMVSPAARVIREVQPSFKWKPLDGAISYRINVINQDLPGDEMSRTDLTTTEWRFDAPLKRGYHYRWQVIASTQAKPVYALFHNQKYANFFVLSEKILSQIVEAEKRYRGSSDALKDLALGLRYAEAGLLEEAEIKLEAYLKANPQSLIAKHLLEEVRRTRNKLK